MTFKASIVLLACVAGFAHHGCPPDPSPPQPDAADAAPPPTDAAPPTDASRKDAGATDYNLACAALALSGCVEGQNPNCAKTMQANQESRINDYKPACLIPCKTKTCVHACGKAVTCP